MKKVLIVDDNSLAAQGIAQNIPWSQLGIEVAGLFFDGQSVLAQLDKEKPDIIISDIKMPGITGLEMTRAILEKYTDIKIILISAYSDFQYAQEALRLGAFDYIEKPIDYDYLKEIVENAAKQLDQEARYLESIRRSRPAMVENFFYNLIHSSPDDARHHLKDYIPYLELPLNSRYYASLVVDIENTDEVKQQFGFEKYYMSQMALKDELASVFQNCPLTYILLKHNRLILIIGLQVHSRADAIRSIYDSLADLLERKTYLLLNYNIGIGDLVRDIWHIQQSYENAKLALEYRFFFSQKKIFDIRDCMNKNPLSNSWSSKQEEQLIQILCKKDPGSLKTYTEQLTELFLQIQDKRQIFVILYSLSNRILKFFYDINLEDQELTASITSIYQDMDSYRSCEEICLNLYRICTRICDCLTQSVNNHHHQLCQSVTKYIREHYTNPDLSLNELALHVNISNAHLSSIFKNTTGISISDAINNARIEAAQLMLRSTSYSIKEISERIGYANQYYFSSCFKKKTDMTPSSYRAKTL